MPNPPDSFRNGLARLLTGAGRRTSRAKFGGATLCWPMTFEALNPPRRLLMGSGPSNPEPRVLQALGSAPLAADDPAFGGSPRRDRAAGAGGVPSARRQSRPGLAGASRSGIEAVMASVDRTGRPVLVGVYGHFGELLCTLATLPRRQRRARRRRVGYGGRPRRAAHGGQTPSAEAGRHRPRRHVDGHRPAARRRSAPPAATLGSLLLVDAVLSSAAARSTSRLGASTRPWAGCRSASAGRPGMAPVAVSERLFAACTARRTPAESAYLDLARLEATWSRTPGSRIGGHVDLDAAGGARGARHGPGGGSRSSAGRGTVGRVGRSGRARGDGPASCSAIPRTRCR